MTDTKTMLERIELALEQAQDCIHDETPEDMTHEEAREDTISKIRRAMDYVAALRAAAPSIPAEVRETCALICDKHAEWAESKIAAEPVAWGRVIDGKAVTLSFVRTLANDEPLYASPPAAQTGVRELGIERALREFFRPLDAVKRSSDDIERVYYSGFPLKSLAIAITRTLAASDSEKEKK